MTAVPDAVTGQGEGGEVLGEEEGPALVEGIAEAIGRVQVDGQDASVMMRWQHPRRGAVIEVLCARHEGDVLRALRALGIGCSAATPADVPVTECGRCAAERAGVEPRLWLGLMGMGLPS